MVAVLSVMLLALSERTLDLVEVSSSLGAAMRGVAVGDGLVFWLLRTPCGKGEMREPVGWEDK